MMPVKQTLGSSGPSVPIALDYEPLSRITAAVFITGGGSAQFQVQVTLDNVSDQDGPNYVAPASARWFTLALAPTIASGYDNVSGPWRAIRLNIGALTAPVIFQVAQAVTPRA